MDDYNFNKYKKDNFSSMEFDNGLLYTYTKKQIEFYKEIVKKFSHISFILRPHPTDFEYIKKFQKLFSNNKNVKIDSNFDVNFWIQKCDKIVSGPGSVIIEALYLNKQTFIYYDKSNKMHNALYGDHISLKLNKQNIFQNLVNLQNLFKAKKIHKSLMNN